MIKQMKTMHLSYKNEKKFEMTKCEKFLSLMVMR